MKSYLLGTLLSFLTLQPVAFSGVGSSGGGDVIICDKGIPFLRPFLGSRRVYLADTFDFFRTGGDKLINLLDENQALKSAVMTLNAKEEGLGTLIETTIAELNFQEVKSVEELDDDNIVLDAPGCHKKQLAVQDILEKRVRVNKKLRKKLSPAERALFKIHEAYIHIRNAPQDTTPIRNGVQAIVESPDFDTFLKDVVPKVTKIDVLRRTKLMLKRELNRREEPLSTDLLSRLGGNLRALETPIETNDFADLHVNVDGNELSDLYGSEWGHDQGTVATLRDYIWSVIPEIFKHTDHPDTTPVRKAVSGIVESPEFGVAAKQIVPKATRIEIGRRTTLMLARMCRNLGAITSIWLEDPLCVAGQRELGILATWIVDEDFKEFRPNINPYGLESLKTGLDLANYIWNSIPEIFKE